MKANIYLLPLFLACSAATGAEARRPGYTVVVSQSTQEDSKWKRVVAALVNKHDARTVVYAGSVRDALKELRAEFPRYACFVAKPEEATRSFVSHVHRLTRQLDDDPYTDAIWGILTGYDADNALEIAQTAAPLVVRRVASGTEVELRLCEEGVWYCELEKHRMVRKKPGGEPVRLKAPGDTTKALVDALNVYGAQLFVTSGHATERDWQIGYRYRNGSFRSEEGRLYGLDTKGARFPIDSTDPKVYLPTGNCLMGHIDGRSAMALAFMKSAGVRQMIGYTVVTWYGYAGWGCLDYFLEQPGRYTFAEAFFANHQALLQRLEAFFPGIARAEVEPGKRLRGSVRSTPEAETQGLTANDARGLLFDRDVLAFYGDPAWEARMAAKRCAWDQDLEERDGVYTFEVKPNLGERTFEPVNSNGSQRGYRPIVEIFPHRLTDVQVLEGQELRPVITDNFLLLPNPRKCDADRKYRVVFKARKIERKSRTKGIASP